MIEEKTDEKDQQAIDVENVNEPQGGRSQSPVAVHIYVADHCSVCEYAYEVAEAIRDNFPQVDVQIVNLSKTTEAVPETVFATPTYLLNGRLWSLGNPSPQDVRSRLTMALRRSGTAS